MLSEPLPPPSRRPPSPRSIVWALLAAGLLAAGIAVRLHFSPSLPAPHSSVAVLPTPLPAAASVKSANPSSQVPVSPVLGTPLTVSLSGGAGKPVRVGTPVMLLAYAELPPGQSATLAVSYTRNHGPQTLLALVQGSLATLSWTPTSPGQYEFTASAMDAHKKSALSHRLLIAADAAPAPVLPMPIVIAPLPPMQVAAMVPTEKASRARPKRLAQKRFVLVQTPTSPKAITQQPAVSKAYHVAAGAFIVRPVAETLAAALQRRGFHASVRRGSLLYHKQSYVVQTGSYLRPADANRQRDTLRHSGYPAYIFR